MPDVTCPYWVDGRGCKKFNVGVCSFLHPVYLAGHNICHRKIRGECTKPHCARIHPDMPMPQELRAVWHEWNTLQGTPRVTSTHLDEVPPKGAYYETIFNYLKDKSKDPLWMQAMTEITKPDGPTRIRPTSSHQADDHTLDELRDWGIVYKKRSRGSPQLRDRGDELQDDGEDPEEPTTSSNHLQVNPPCHP